VNKDEYKTRSVLDFLYKFQQTTPKSGLLINLPCFLYFILCNLGLPVIVGLHVQHMILLRTLALYKSRTYLLTLRAIARTFAQIQTCFKFMSITLMSRGAIAVLS